MNSINGDIDKTTRKGWPEEVWNKVSREDKKRGRLENYTCEDLRRESTE